MLRQDGLITCDLFTFIDTEGVVTPDKELCWQACRVFDTKQSYLGIMDVPHKYPMGSQTLGAWAGTMVHILLFLGVCALTQEKKWKRIKALVAKWCLHLEAGDTEL